jgi:4-hydroxy-tetrahydrodipicolinate reductase
MKIALIGYGAMGRLVETLARQRGHEIVAALSSRNAQTQREKIEALRGADVAIDFSVGDAAPENVAACLAAGVPLVEGATGWQDRLPVVRQMVETQGGAMVYGANFSLGVNIFYRVAARAAQLFAAVEGYEPFIEEAHHSRKKDAPSGTALKLRDIVAAGFPQDFSVASTRAGHIPGTHRVGFDSAADTVTLIHEARSREGFAAGALVAAQWIIGKQGVYEFPQVIDEILLNQ